MAKKKAVKKKAGTKYPIVIAEKGPQPEQYPEFDE